MRRKTLGISLLYGRFRAVTVDRWGVGKIWEAPFMVKESQDVEEAVATAVESTRYSGRDVSLILEDTFLDHQFLKVPPMKSKDMWLYLTRKVEHEKRFKGEAVYSFNHTSSPAGGEIISLNILPRSFLDNLLQACRNIDLNPVQLVPLSTVLAQQFRNLSIKDNEMAMVVTEAGDKLPLVIGKTDGSILLDRYLSRDGSKGEGMERINVEINRSIVFSKQQFGEKVAMVRLMGRFSSDFVKTLQNKLNIPVECIQDSDTSFWVQEALKIPVGHESNLISADIRRKSSKRRAFKIMSFLLFGMWVSSIALAVLTELMIVRVNHNIKWAKRELVTMQAEKADWDKRYDELDRLRRSAMTIDEERLEPLSGWFVGYLGNTLPHGLVLTKARVFQDGGGWKIEVEGNSNIGLKNTAKELNVFETRLKEGPYKVFITGDWRKDWLKHLQEGMVRADDGKPFSMGGSIR